MRSSLRLLPIPLLMLLSLQAHAGDDHPLNWGLCPIGDAVAPFPDAPTIPEGLNAKPAGDIPTDIDGDVLSGTQEQPVFNGNVTMRRGAQFVGADQLSFDQNTGHYTAKGSVRFQTPSLRVVAASAEGDQDTETHTIQDLHYQLLERRGNGIARSLELADEKGSLHGSTYSTCAPSQRQWELRASRIDVNNDTGMAVAYGARLHIGKIPVLYLPWFKFPIDDKRRTGLLYPAISNSGRNGFDWRQPIYLNLAPNFDITLNPRMMSKRGVQLGAELRYLLKDGEGTLDVAWMDHDKLRDRSRSQLQFNANQSLSRHWQARAALDLISDARYIEDFSSSLEGLSQTTTFSDLGVYGRGRGWSAGLTADHWQLADFTLSDAVLPYDRLPRAFASIDRPAGRGLRWGFDAEAVRFHHPVYAGGARIDLKPWISLPLEGDAWFVRPTLAYRYTGYSLDHALGLALGNDHPTRGQSIFSLDAGVYFDRELHFKQQYYLQTIEPRLFYLNVPYTDQTDMPVFDTQPLTFSWNQLFRDNRYTGGDRQADANQLTLAISTRMIRQSDGRERFSFSLGQIHYYRDALTTLPGEPLTARGRSAWVADANYAPTDRWTIGASYQHDPKFQRTDLASVRARYLLPDSGVFNLSYRYRRALLEQVDLSFLYPINASWSVVGREYFSLRDRRSLESLFGVQWDSCCIATRVVARRYVRDRSGKMDTTLMFEIELKGLGSAGQDTRSTLRRAILGYNRDDLYLIPPQIATGHPGPSTEPTTP